MQQGSIVAHTASNGQGESIDQYIVLFLVLYRRVCGHLVGFEMIRRCKPPPTQTKFAQRPRTALKWACRKSLKCASERDKWIELIVTGKQHQMWCAGKPQKTPRSLREGGIITPGIGRITPQQKLEDTPVGEELE